MTRPKTPPNNDAETDDGATAVAPRPADDPDRPAGEPDDERRRGYEPL
jgi:hypothetical protein